MAGGTTHFIGRGAAVIALLDVWAACVVLITMISAKLFSIKSGISYGSTEFADLISLSSWQLFVAICPFLFQLIFGVLLLLGVFTARSGLVYSWYIANLIFISLLTAGTLIGAFFSVRIHIQIFRILEVLSYRAMQTWIVFEFHQEIKYNHYR